MPKAMGVVGGGVEGEARRQWESLGTEPNLPASTQLSPLLPLLAPTFTVTTTSKMQKLRKTRKLADRPLRWLQVPGGRKSLLILLQRREGKEKEDARGRERSREKGIV